MQSPSAPLPDWLTDESRLREEGVVYGLTGAPPDEKLAALRFYFGLKLRPAEALLERLETELEELNQEKALTKNQQVSLLRAEEEWQHQRVSRLGQAVLGLLGAGVALVGCGFVLYAVAVPQFAYPLPLALLAVITGLLQPVGSFSPPVRPFGHLLPPLVVALAVGGLAASQYSLPVTLALALLTGTLLVLAHPALQRYGAIFAQASQSVASRRQRRRLTEQLALCETRQRALEAERQTSQLQAETLQEELAGLTKLFLSEYNLARTWRGSGNVPPREAVSRPLGLSFP